jgi:hypothetical protein
MTAAAALLVVGGVVCLLPSKRRVSAAETPSPIARPSQEAAAQGEERVEPQQLSPKVSTLAPKNGPRVPDAGSNAGAGESSGQR